MYDSHTHLNNEDLFPQWQHYMDLFEQAGGKGLVNSGASEFYNEKGIEIAKISLQKYPNLRVKSTLGRHPLEAVENLITKENYIQKVQSLKQQYLSNKEHVVAIGEVGIDVHFPGGQESLGLQKDLFSLQCDLAQELNLPLVIHSRDDFKQTIDVLKNYKNQTIYFHCWGYGPEEYCILRDMIPNLFIGFCGNISYKNAQTLRDTLVIVDKNQILMETDAPYLAAQVVRGQTNHPARVKYVYDFVSVQLGVNSQEFSACIEKNIKTAYNIK